MNKRPSGERVHIALSRQAELGKSSLVNAVTGQALSVVSDVKGTTTDPVSKTMELLPLGPVGSSTPPASTTRGRWGSCGCNKPARSFENRPGHSVVVDGGRRKTGPMGKGADLRCLTQREYPFPWR